MKKSIQCFAAACLLPFLVIAQQDDITTDRPGESFSPDIVLPAHFQLEAGFRKEHNKGDLKQVNQFLYPSAFLKFGVFKNLEVNMLLQEEGDYIYAPAKEKVASGLDPVRLGLKYNFFEDKGLLPKVSVLASSSIPKLASPDFKGVFAAPLFRLIMESDVTKKLSVSYNLGEQWDDDDVHGLFFYSFSPQYEISEKLKGFAEIYGYVSKVKAPENGIDAGLLYLVKSNIQLDISGGFGISKAASDNFVEVGFSFRLPN